MVFLCSINENEDDCVVCLQRFLSNLISRVVCFLTPYEPE